MSSPLLSIAAVTTPNAIYVPVSVPVPRLPPGDYFISLSGIMPEGDGQPVARYDFRIPLPVEPAAPSPP